MSNRFISRLLIAASLTLIICTFFPRAVPAQTAPQNPTLVLYAFDAEGKLLTGKMTIEKTVKILGRTVQVGTLAGKSIVLAESGIGMTNAAMTTQKLIDTYHPIRVLFTGIAGAVDSTVHIGDIVVCQNWSQHDFGYIGKDGFKPEGVETRDNLMDTIIEKKQFDVDSSLFAAAMILSSNNLPFDKIGERVPKLRVEGIGVTGNMFIDNIEKRLWLADQFHALITDMESAAVAQVCTANRVPFIIFRSASDLAGGSGSSTASDEIKQFFKIAADNSSRVLEAFLKKI